MSTLQDLERVAIRAALEHLPSIEAAAKSLGISRATLYRKIKTYELEWCTRKKKPINQKRQSL